MNFDQYFARITANNSPDIIESTFGIFKYKQSPNKLNGVTVWGVILAYAGESVSMTTLSKNAYAGQGSRISISGDIHL